MDTLPSSPPSLPRIRTTGTMQESLNDRLSTMGIIFVISLFAVSFPAISKRSSFLPIPKIVFFIGKHFGTGVILSTAFCHLLKDSFQALTDPLVESRYPGVGEQTGLIILGSLLLIFLVEYISTSYVDHLHSHQEQSHQELYESPRSSRNPSRAPSTNANDRQPIVASLESTPGTITEATPLLTASSTLSRHSLDSQHHTHDAPIRPSQIHKPHYLASIVTNTPRHSRSSEYFYIINDINHHLNNGEYHLVGGKKSCVCVCVCPASSGHGQESSGHTKVVSHVSEAEQYDHESRPEEHEHDHPPELTRKRQIVGILVLQMGIMIHSLVIGLTLAITSGAEFTTLTTAIIFHQLFEGLSLGIRIAAIPPPPPESLPLHSRSSSRSSSFFRKVIPGLNKDEEPKKSSWLQSLLSILFAVTTPAGMCLGILVFSATGKRSEAARMMLTQGLMSAISAGMLIYAATVEMLAADFVFGNVGGGGGHGHSHGEEFMGDEDENQNTWKRKVLALVSLCAGVLGMGLIGLGE